MSSVAAVAFEFPNDFTIVVDRNRRAALSAKLSAFAVNDVSGTGANVLASASGTRRVWNGGKSKNNRDVFRFKVNEMQVRGFAGVVVEQSGAAAHDGFREGHRVERVVDRVAQNVNAPVAHFAGSGVPHPVPVVMEVVSIQRQILSWSEPRIVIDFSGNLHRRFALSNRLTNRIMVDRHGLHLAQGFVFVNEFLNLGLNDVAELLSAHLADFVVFASGVDNLTSFPRRMSQGFFNVNIFSRLHCQNRGEAVPVVRRCYNDSVQVIVVKQLAEIRYKRGIGMLSTGVFGASHIRVGEACEIDVLTRSFEIAHVLTAANAAADNRHVDAVVDVLG